MADVPRKGHPVRRFTRTGYHVVRIRSSGAPRRRDSRRARRRRALAPRRRGRGDDHPREAALEARPRRDRPAGGPAAGGDRRGLRHERQDDDGRDGRRDPPAAVSPRPQPLRGEPRLRRRLDVTRRRACGARPLRGRRSGAARGVAAGAAARRLSRQSLSRPARPVRRARARRRALAGGGAQTARRHRASRQRGRPSARRARRRARALRRLRPGRSPSRPAVAAARGRLEILRALRDAVRLRGSVRRASRRVPLSQLRTCATRTGRRRAGRRAARSRPCRVRPRHT